MNQRKDSYEASEQLVALHAGTRSRYERYVDDVTGLIISAEYNAQTTCSGILAIIIEHVMPIAVDHAMIVNPLATHALKTAQIHGL